MLDQIMDVLSVLIALAPILIPLLVKIIGYIAQLSNNQKLVNLHSRANIIVEAMEQSGLANDQKKRKAMEKLAYYADEVGIAVTVDQLDDYIESAYTLFKLLKK